MINVKTWVELERKSNCGHILVKGFCANCKKVVVTRKTRLVHGIKFCSNCCGCKYKDFITEEDKSKGELYEYTAIGR